MWMDGWRGRSPSLPSTLPVCLNHYCLTPAQYLFPLPLPPRHPPSPSTHILALPASCDTWTLYLPPQTPLPTTICTCWLYHTLLLPGFPCFYPMTALPLPCVHVFTMPAHLSFFIAVFVCTCLPHALTFYRDICALHSVLTKHGSTCAPCAHAHTRTHACLPFPCLLSESLAGTPSPYLPGWMAGQDWWLVCCQYLPSPFPPPFLPSRHVLCTCLLVQDRFYAFLGQGLDGMETTIHFACCDITPCVLVYPHTYTHLYPRHTRRALRTV